MAVKNVFILGAGASVETGAPVMKNFFDKTEDLIISKRISLKEDQDSISNVFDLIRKSLSSYANSNIDLNNIETIFGLLEMALIVKELHDYSEDQINRLRTDLITLIVRTLEETTQIKVNDSGFSTSSSYIQLCQIIKQSGLENNTVISFNYDMAFEAAFSTIGNHDFIDYGFDYFKTRSSPQQSLGFYKLHGSINWYENLENTSLQAIDILEIYRFGAFRQYLNDDLKLRGNNVLPISQLRTALKNDKSFEFLNKCSETPFIIPPSWNKSAYHNSVSHIWQKAVKSIMEASNIFIIGYSLPESDLFFKYLFTLGTLQNSRIRMLNVYDPNNLIEENYKRMLGNGILSRFHFHSMPFKEAVGHIKQSLI